MVGKPGLDGHSNGAEQIAVRGRDAGMEVIYEGIRLTPEQIVGRGPGRGRRTSSACRSCPARTWSWSPRWCGCLRGRGRRHAPVVAGGIIPEEDRPRLMEDGVAAVFTPKDFELTRIRDLVADLAIAQASDAAPGSAGPG
ncbi:MAG: hypothetical protein MZU95_07380 [Desulfomicrobium escambiense]|nr:hypothetical protein [Desulfomicrobium escambiense]